MKVKGGRWIYGEAIGIVLLDRKYPLLPGNVGNASTYNFPVRIKILKGYYNPPFLPFRDGSGNYTTSEFIKLLKELEEEGVRAITCSCGFFAASQKEAAAAVKIPVFTSPLMLIPLVYRMLKPEQKVGVITASAKALTKTFLEPVGVDDSIPLAIAGCDNCPEFQEVVSDRKWTADTRVWENEVVSVAKELVEKNPDVGAIVLECSDMPPFAAAIQKAVNLPVFDYICFINMVYQAVVQKRYSGFL